MRSTVFWSSTEVLGEFFLQRFRTTNDPNKYCRKRRWGLFVVSFVAVSCFFLLGASRAEATCGDYLHQMGTSQGGLFRIGMLDHNQSSIPDNAFPIRGPSCQHAPLPQPVPTTVLSVEPQDRWGWMARIVVHPAELASFLAHLNEPISVPTIASRLDRPPKV